MSNTLSVFKSQQEKMQQSLGKLLRFVSEGEKYGLNPDASLLEKLKIALASANQGVLKVALIGGFSEGKTSIASAWLERLDQSMKISQQESSNEIKIYRLGNDIELIDTPGLFGFKEQQNEAGDIEKYKETTRKYVSEAHLVLYVMNSANPVKESHREDLQWLFRELNLLPRTVFVLSRFDEVADVEDDWDYRENLKIKQANVAERLKNMLNLNDAELAHIKIVGIAANPFGEGAAYWLEHLEEFRKISRIQTLQDATRQTIEQNDGAESIVLQAQKSMVQDVLGRQLPIVRQKQENLNNELKQLAGAARHLDAELKKMAANIVNVRGKLNEFVIEYFNSLVRRVKGTDMTTFADFYDSNIGAGGDILSARINQEFDRQCQAVSSSLNRISLDFDHEVSRFNDSVGSDLVNKGLSFLSRQTVNKTHVLAARDGIVSAGKMFGADLGKYLKFRPWGATNFAKNINGFLAVFGLAMEVWDSYKKHQKEQKFRETVAEIVSMLEEQRKGLLEALGSQDYINQLFPAYQELKEKIDAVEIMYSETDQRKKAFSDWQREGEIIEAEFRMLD